MKIKILLLLVFPGMVKSFILPASGSFPDQYREKEFKSKIEAISKEIKDINGKIIKITPESHELHEYFIESYGIIERLVGFIKEDIAREDWIAA
ncbi:MAG: hypothetical protein QG611_45, partial [Bacteroidota bacterium]|nr:hypothetical protein [Bacteroidota bacterium]